MKVFISWSGETSKSLAETLRGWFPSVIQAVKPYFSPDDITKGARWSSDIAKELEECKIGLLCLTPDNLEAPWIMFEAGALSKSLSTARVCPLLFGIDPANIKGPLVQFQAAPFSKEEMKKVIKMMNQELGPTALAGDVLDSVFEMWWPKLEEKVEKIMSSAQTDNNTVVRPERDILEEILARVRATTSSPIRESIHPAAVKDLIEACQKLSFEAKHVSPEMRGNLSEIIEQLRKPVEYISHKIGLDNDWELVQRELFSEKPTAPEIMEVENLTKPKPIKRLPRRH